MLAKWINFLKRFDPREYYTKYSNNRQAGRGRERETRGLEGEMGWGGYFLVVSRSTAKRITIRQRVNIHTHTHIHTSIAGNTER